MDEARAFVDWVSSVIEDLLQKGFTPPLTVVHVSTDGQLLATRHTAAEGGERVAQHGTFQRLKYPIHLLCVDAEGRAQHASLEKELEQPKGLN